MNVTSTTSRVELLLHPHEVLSLNSSQHPMAIECRNGVIWVTCSGEYQDHVLQAGKRYVLKNKGTVVIEAIADAQVDIEENQ